MIRTAFLAAALAAFAAPAFALPFLPAVPPHEVTEAVSTEAGPVAEAHGEAAHKPAPATENARPFALVRK